jgi:hypothetical protein
MRAALRLPSEGAHLTLHVEKSLSTRSRLRLAGACSVGRIRVRITKPPRMYRTTLVPSTEEKWQ